jgi:hypothetical protein
MKYSLYSFPWLLILFNSLRGMEMIYKFPFPKSIENIIRCPDSFAPRPTFTLECDNKGQAEINISLLNAYMAGEFQLKKALIKSKDSDPQDTAKIANILSFPHFKNKEKFYNSFWDNNLEKALIILLDNAEKMYEIGKKYSFLDFNHPDQDLFIASDQNAPFKITITIPFHYYHATQLIRFYRFTHYLNDKGITNPQELSEEQKSHKALNDALFSMDFEKLKELYSTIPRAHFWLPLTEYVKNIGNPNLK